MLKLVCVAFALAAATTQAAEVASAAAPPPAVSCVSPDGLVAIELEAGESGARWRVRYRDEVVVDWSPLGLRFADGAAVGADCAVASVESRDVADRFTQHPGKRREVVAVGRETTVRLREGTGARLAWEVDLRAYDDGVAMRYRVPAQSGLARFRLAEERTGLIMPRGSRGIVVPMAGFATSYEGRYRHERVEELPSNELSGLPALFRTPAGHWAGFTEADFREYAGAFLERDGEGFRLRLAPRPDEPEVAVDWDLPHRSPWRVMLLGEEAGRLIESDLVLALNEPCALADVSWIEPAKTTFPWWNGFALDGIDFKPGLNTATAKHYIDFCAAHGIERHSLDGVENLAWYGGPIVPYEGASPAAGRPGLDFEEVLAHARERGVRMRLWMHWEAAREHMREAFPRYERLGVEGVMLDFIDRDDQLAHRFLREAVALAAKHRLTVTLHGCPKPTGLERVYPNLLTHEGVLNLEWDKWDVLGCPPDHQVTVAFTRMLAGPLDFHQGSFRGVTPAAFVARDVAPLVIGGAGRTLASYVVYQNHLSMVADSPSAYAGRPELKALAAIPASWDDTRFVAGGPDDFVAVARRRGGEWFLGVMTDERAHRLELPLRFLGTGDFDAEVWADSGSPDEVLTPRRLITSAATPLALEVAPAGGAYVRFSPRR